MVGECLAKRKSYHCRPTTGGWSRTTYLQVMSLVRCRFSTPAYPDFHTLRDRGSVMPAAVRHDRTSSSVPTARHEGCGLIVGGAGPAYVLLPPLESMSRFPTRFGTERKSGSSGIM